MKEKLNRMLEALIKDDTAAATEALHEYLTSKTRALILGEAEDDVDDMDKDDKKSDKKDDGKDDTDKDDKKSDKTSKKEKKPDNDDDLETNPDDVVDDDADDVVDDDADDDKADKKSDKPSKNDKDLKEAVKYAKDMTAAERSALAKKARSGKDIGKRGKGFEKVAAKAAKEYGSKEAGERVAAAAMWKNAGK